MNDEELINKLTLVFRKVFSDNNISINTGTTAEDIEQWDSLSHPVLIDAVETEFGVKFKLKELIKMKNVGDLIFFLNDKLNARS